ncbi:MAG: hypothetical protein KOO63_10205, partial [Bacteroidales bacterium]|nr:hypothetical protein [Candidatus Latescibacterota bacterium]
MAGVGGISGLVTGLDTVDLISKMLDLERRPIINLQNRIASNIDLKSAYETLEANLLALKIDSRNLVRRDIFKTIGAMSSNEDIITASVNGTAATGSYTLSVSQLAQSHQVASLEFVDKDETIVGTGTITINSGTASPVEIVIDASNNTLENVADAINSSGAGVQAVIVNVGGDDASYKLMLSGASTGADNLITIDEDLSGGTGLQLGEVDAVTDISWGGSSTVTSGGNYTGAEAATFTFTVAAGGGGTVGTDTLTLEYTDGANISGMITIPSSYSEGASVQVYGGLEITLGGGTVVEGDTF